jgi:protein RecA
MAKPKTAAPEVVTALSRARDVLRKMSSVDIQNRKIFKVLSQFPHISSGSMIINHLIGGSRVEGSNDFVCPGFPRGRITEVYGGESSGKTTLGISASVQTQLCGGVVGYLDFENAFSDGYAAAQGLSFDEDKLDLWVPTNMEEGFEIMGAWVDAGVDLIVVDSIHAMVPAATQEKGISADTTMGLRARKISDFLSKLTTRMRGSKTAIILINQMRSRIKTSMYDQGPDEDTTGGRALKFYASIRLKLERKKQEFIEIKDTLTNIKQKKPYGTYTKVTCVKNKLDSHQNDSGEIFIRYGKGIDNVRTVIDIAENRDIIFKEGAYYSYENAEDPTLNFRVQGKEKAHLLLQENKKTFQAVWDDLVKKLNFQGDVAHRGASSEEIAEGKLLVEECQVEESDPSYDKEENSGIVDL